MTFRGHCLGGPFWNSRISGSVGGRDDRRMGVVLLVLIDALRFQDVNSAREQLLCVCIGFWEEELVHLRHLRLAGTDIASLLWASVIDQWTLWL